MIPSSFKTIPTLIRQATTPTTMPAIERPRVRAFVLLTKPTMEKPMLAGSSINAYAKTPTTARTKPIIMYASVIVNGRFGLWTG